MHNMVLNCVEEGCRSRVLLMQVLSACSRHLDDLLCRSSHGKAVAFASVAVDLRDAWNSNTAGDLELESKLGRPMTRFRSACPAPLRLSVAPDKSRLGNLALLNCPAAIPGGFGCAYCRRRLGWVSPPPQCAAWGL